MNAVDTAIDAARRTLAEFNDLRDLFPWLDEEFERAAFGTPCSLGDPDYAIYERYITLRVRASLAAETLRVWEVL